MAGYFRKAVIRRSFTHWIGRFIDSCLPPLIRDNKYFMYPFFYLAYKGKNVKYFMNFKSLYYTIDQAALERIYQEYDTIGTERDTDLNAGSVRYILARLAAGPGTALDVACGQGYLADQLAKRGYRVQGADLFEDRGRLDFPYVKANIENLPFEDKSFDIVTCTHTLEHAIDIKKAVREIKRVAARQIVVVVPCQRFHFYTIDLHLHFFPRKEMLAGLMGMKNHSIAKIGGDWVFIGYVDPPI